MDLIKFLVKPPEDVGLSVHLFCLSAEAGHVVLIFG